MVYSTEIPRDRQLAGFIIGKNRCAIVAMLRAIDADSLRLRYMQLVASANNTA
jgi:hypothetical protein